MRHFLRRSEIATGRKRSRWLEFLLSPGQAASDYVESHARRVGDVMTHDVETATPDTPEMIESNNEEEPTRGLTCLI